MIFSSRVEHYHLANLWLDKSIQQSIGYVNGIFFKPVSNVYSLLDGSISSFSQSARHDFLVDLMWKDQRGEDVLEEGADSTIYKVFK